MKKPHSVIVKRLIFSNYQFNTILKIEYLLDEHYDVPPVPLLLPDYQIYRLDKKS